MLPFSSMAPVLFYEYDNNDASMLESPHQRDVLFFFNGTRNPLLV